LNVTSPVGGRRSSIFETVRSPKPDRRPTLVDAGVEELVNRLERSELGVCTHASSVADPGPEPRRGSPGPLRDGVLGAAILVPT